MFVVPCRKGGKKISYQKNIPTGNKKRKKEERLEERQEKIRPPDRPSYQTIGSVAGKASDPGLSNGLTDRGLELFPPYTFPSSDRPLSVRPSERE